MSKSYGRAPPRSQRSRLMDKGYKEYDLKDGRYSFGHAKSEADSVVERLHKNGFLARVIKIRASAWDDYHYQVMYKEK